MEPHAVIRQSSPLVLTSREKQSMQEDLKRHTKELKGNQESPNCFLGPCKKPSYSPAKVFRGKSFNLTSVLLNTLLLFETFKLVPVTFEHRIFKNSSCLTH